MKPLLALVLSSAVPVTGLAVLGGNPGIADSRHSNTAQEFLLASAPPPVETKRIWVQLVADTTLKALAKDLSLSIESLKSLNDVSTNDLELKKGAWVVLPDVNLRLIALSAHLSSSKIRTSAPVTAPPAAVDVVKVSNGDSVASIASRHGLTITDVRKLNPGVNLARLVIGSNLRVAKALPGSVLAIRPGVSGGASWPYIPYLGGSTTQVDTPEKQRIREQIELTRQRELAAAERRERESQEAFERRYKTFGDCTYDWQSWGKSPSGVRSVETTRCLGTDEVAVDCRNYKVNERIVYR